MIQREFEKRLPGDHPNRQAVRNYLVSTCTEFLSSGFADSKFLIELLSGEDQKFWACISEALIAAQLRRHTFGERGAIGKGPDFLVMNGPRKVWIEVVCPEPIDVPSDWLEVDFESAYSLPDNEILLRWMSAIKSKIEQLIGSPDGKKKGYLNTGLVNPQDSYVIAVNACRLRNGPFPGMHGISQFPFPAEAVFPIGPFAIQIDTTTLQAVDRGHQYRPHILNKNGSEVPTAIFLDPRYSSISAIWGLDLSGSTAIGNKEPMIVVHNPNASSPVPSGFLPSDDDYIATLNDEGFELTRRPMGRPDAG